MTPDPTSGPTENPGTMPSTAGMTTRVVKGSIWTLFGQVLPLGVSLIATPFVIRMLGAESYGVLILVVLIPTYLGFADFGMGIASTKFGSEAYGAGSGDREARVVRTAALIALCSSVPIGLVIFLFSGSIIGLFNVPEHLHAEAVFALKLASITFVVNFLNNIFNTPQLARLRMDLNTLVSVVPRVIGIIATPIVLYFGGGIVGAVFVLMAASLLTLLGHIFVSRGLLYELLAFSLEKPAIRPLLKFGGGLAISGIAAVLLVNLEKLVLTRFTSVKTLAYYSVAFTFATMATNFTGSMSQSLVPAFSQLLSPDKYKQLNSLFGRSLRINVMGLLPILAFLFVIAKPLFTVWAGPDFGLESTVPFYILLIGVFFNLNAYVPGSVLLASGRTDIIAKLYWFELLPYVALIALLTARFGAIGAAAAWSSRVLFDAIFVAWISKNVVGVSFKVFEGKAMNFVAVFAVLAPPVLVTVFWSNYVNCLFLLLPVSIFAYLVLVWKKFLLSEERLWFYNKINMIFLR